MTITIGFLMKARKNYWMVKIYWMEIDEWECRARSLRYRNAETFEYPMAMIAWLENVRGGVTDWETIGKPLMMGTKSYPPEMKVSLQSTSDIIVFDFLIDGV